MARTLILNISAEAQLLPAVYGGFSVAVGHGRVVSDESSVAVQAMGGFEAMDGKWAVSAISTDTALGDIDVGANGVALLATFVPSGGGGGGGGGPVAWSDVTGKPSFATVATSGSYSDLSGKPTLAAVATSGAYSDLGGTPSIPAAGNTTATTISTTGSAGVQATFARVDHVHAHGSLSGGSLHATATTIAAGFLSAADKTKLDGLASVATSGAYSDLSGTPTLSTVATTGSYSDLTGKPSLFSGAYADLTGKPSLFSGSYTDLTNKPSLATVATTGAYSDLSGRPALAAIATSGSYNDLTDLPMLVSVASTGSYTDLSGTPELATVATTGSYADLLNKPTLFDGAYASLTGKPSLAAVATSGSYNDLSNKPDFSVYLTSVPDGSVTTAKVANSAITDAKIAGVAAAKVTGLATVATSGAYADLTGKPTKTYDISSYAGGSLALGATTMKLYAPKALTLTALNQGGGAVVKVQVDNVDAAYPQSVTAGQVISTVVTTAGTDNYFTISAVEA